MGRPRNRRHDLRRQDRSRSANSPKSPSPTGADTISSRRGEGVDSGTPMFGVPASAGSTPIISDRRLKAGLQATPCRRRAIIPIPAFGVPASAGSTPIISDRRLKAGLQATPCRRRAIIPDSRVWSPASAGSTPAFSDRPPEGGTPNRFLVIVGHHPTFCRSREWDIPSTPAPLQPGRSFSRYSAALLHGHSVQSPT